MSINEMWKCSDNLCPKFKEEVPVAKYDHFGFLVTEPEEIKKLLSLEFKQRFRTRPERPDLKGLKNGKIQFFQCFMK